MCGDFASSLRTLAVLSMQDSVRSHLISAIKAPNDDAELRAVRALHHLGTRETLTVAQDLCRSASPKKRRLGCTILAQLGVPERTFPRECVATLFELLRTERAPQVLETLFLSFWHLAEYVDAQQVISSAARYKTHPDDRVRWGVVMALYHHTDQSLALDMLLELMNDDDSDVREWATFAVGAISDVDSFGVREALAARLTDIEAHTRGEALFGLAKRGDSRAVAIIAGKSPDFTETYHFSEAEALLKESGTI
jgi:HEAT repeat protein